MSNTNSNSLINSQALGKHLVRNFYQDHGIKQNHSCSGGFRIIEKATQSQKIKTKSIEERDLFKEFGLSKTNVQSYKIDHNYVPDTKEELADKLVQKLQHKMHKMNYYRNKYYGDINRSYK